MHCEHCNLLEHLVALTEGKEEVKVEIHNFVVDSDVDVIVDVVKIVYEAAKVLEQVVLGQRYLYLIAIDADYELV